MRKYLTAFRLSLAQTLMYRANFFFGRVRELVVFGGLLYLFRALPSGAGGYDESRLLTYILVGALLAPFIFEYAMSDMADEIAEGDLVNFLVRPMHYLSFWTSRILAKRMLRIAFGLITVGLLAMVFRGSALVFQRNMQALFFFAVLTLGALVVVQILDFIGAAFAFYAHRAYGPRWLLTVLIQFLSGAFIPIDLLPAWLKSILLATPFPYLMYAPIKAYLGDLTLADFLHALLIQLAWATVLGCALAVLWRRGVKSYEAYGR